MTDLRTQSLMKYTRMSMCLARLLLVSESKSIRQSLILFSCPMVKRGRVSNNYEFEVKYNCSGLIKFPLIQECVFAVFPALRANGTNGGTFCYETLWVSCPMLLFHCCYDFLQVTVGPNPTLSGFFWRCDQVVRQRIANSSPPQFESGCRLKTAC